MGCGKSKPQDGAVTAPALKQKQQQQQLLEESPCKSTIAPTESVRTEEESVPSRSGSRAPPEEPSTPLLIAGGDKEDGGKTAGDIEMGSAAAAQKKDPLSPIAEKEQLLEPSSTDRGEKRDLQLTAGGSASEPAPSAVKAYFAKFAGAGTAGTPRTPLTQTFFSFVGSFIAIAVLGYLHLRLVELKDPHHFVMLNGPFGAMAVLVFSASKAPLAQPRNCIMGNTIGAVSGWLIVKAMEYTPLGGFPWTAAALSVALCIVAQEQLGAVHPPGGASALTYVIVAPLHTLDYIYIFCPAFLGSVVLVCIGCFTNNFSSARAYPQGWGFESAAPAPKPSEAEAASPLKTYFKKFMGAGVVAPPKPPLTQSGFSFFGSFVGISVLAVIDAYFFPRIPVFHLKLIIGSFGAMAVLVFSACKAPLAQPKNAILGNVIGGIVGVTVFEAMKLAGFVGLSWLWLSAALAVSLTIALQEQTGCVHPPGGATALIFVTIPLVQPLGYIYVLSPALLGALLLVSIGLFTNNLSQARTYPQSWS